MEKLDKVLDEYEGLCGLPSFKEEFSHPDNIQQYIGMTREQMEKLSPEDCAEIAILLNGFSFHLQRAYNREIARINWAQNLLRNIVSGRECQYRGSWDSQFAQAVKEDTYCTKLLKLKAYAQQRADRITYLSTSMKNMSDLFKNLQLAKAIK